MATQTQPGRWHRFRVIFRRCRIVVWLVILALSGSLLYLNYLGLPGFIKRPLLEKLHERGLDIQFSRLRWDPVHGLVAENVVFGRTNDVSNPELKLRQMQLLLDYPALMKRQLLVQSLVLRQGRLVWPVPDTNGQPRELSIENIQTDLQLLTNDVWQLDNLQAQFAGAKIRLSGSMTNASVVRTWKIFRSTQKPEPGVLQNHLRRLADTLEQIHFATAPQLNLDIRGDALKVESIAVRLSLEAPGAETPWGTADGIKYSALILPRRNQLPRAEIKLLAAGAATPWITTTNLAATLILTSAEGNTNLVHADLDLTADSVQSRSNHAEAVHFTTQWLHSLTNAFPVSGQAELKAANAVTEWFSAKQILLSGALLQSTNAAPPDASWAWWTNLAPFPLDLECHATGVHSPKLDSDEIFCSAFWRPPELSFDKLTAAIFGGRLDAKANLNVATRDVTFNVATDFDVQKAAPLLTPKAREWLANYSWNHPPHITAGGALVLPASVWTNRNPDWRGEVQPTFCLDGQFHVEDGAFRGVRALTADSHFSYSNMCWRLPDLVVVRPEGRLTFFHESNERTKGFYFRVHSTISPDALRPLLETNQLHGLDLFALSQPPVIDGEVWGRWHDPDAIRAKARVTATNFAVRGQSARTFQTELEYTNRILNLINPRLQRAGDQELTASRVSIVFDEKKIFVTNGYSTADPTPVVRAIGPHAELALEPYHFLRPPLVHVEGAIPMRDVRDADLHFVADGSGFKWLKFEVRRIAGKVDWVGEHLSITDVRADFYRGKASGNAVFDFSKTGHSSDFKFTVVATDADLNWLAMDLTDGKTNKLEGLLTARVEVTNANSADWRTWQGVGRLDLHDGLIWDIPIFGVFSPVLDTVMPGLGSSRARQGSATFTITNGVINSEDLKIETLMARLRYWGTVDLKGSVDARMEAELLRNTWVIGPVLSLALWPVSKTFEYSITGTIHEPKSAPVFIPRVFFFPLHPIQTIKEMMPEDSGQNTNAPPSAAH